MIPEEELERSFIVVDAGLSVGELHGRVRQLEEAPSYLVVALSQGNYSVTPLSEVSRAVYKLGAAALDLPLSRLPQIAQPTGAVQRAAVSLREAERERDRQPQRRLVVLEGDRPAGLLVNERRGSSFGGLPFDLFGQHVAIERDELARRLAARREQRTCPHCGRQFTFYELRADLNAYACPHCHNVLDG